MKNVYKLLNLLYYKNATIRFIFNVNNCCRAQIAIFVNIIIIFKFIQFVLKKIKIKILIIENI